ncbi:MAG: hypothetical protein RIT38_17 [Bacteroidota bacterium]|jgi:dTDP-4-dehydrorhamnose 3,5-epimerase-like enzyme
MAYTISLTTHSDNRGNLTVIEKILPFEIKRLFYIYDVDDSIRGGHRHVNTTQAAICIKGSCKIYCNDGNQESTFLLDNPNTCLVLEAKDWHTMFEFTSDAVLLVLASEYYSYDDYIFDPYNK